MFGLGQVRNGNVGIGVRTMHIVLYRRKERDGSESRWIACTTVFCVKSNAQKFADGLLSLKDPHQQHYAKAVVRTLKLPE